MESLDLPYAKSVLMELLRKDGVPITTLQKIVTSYNTVKKLIDSFEKDGFVEKKELVIGRKTFQISLTPKGRSVAEQLKRAEEISQGKSFTFPDKFAIISYLSDSGPVTLSQLKERYPDALDIIKEFESMKVIRQEIDNSKHPPINRIALTEKGEKIAEKLKEIEEILKR
ncbi:MAG: hypothetical protein ACYDDC_00035 [Thermoplasmataceae archaeon]